MTEGTENKGDALELLGAAYFQNYGFLVRRRIKLWAVADDATDIDLLGIRFSEPIRQERLIVDCRDRKRPHPYERVLWTLGLTSYVKANRSVVVITRPTTRAREFAAQGNVEMVSVEDVERSVAAAKTRP